MRSTAWPRRPGDYGTLVYLLAYGGLRWGEVAALRRRRCVLLRRRVEVAEAVSDVNGRLEYGPTKIFERRWVRLPQFLVERLARRLGSVAADPEEFVFRGQRGAPLRYQSFRRAVWDKAVMEDDRPVLVNAFDLGLEGPAFSVRNQDGLAHHRLPARSRTHSRHFRRADGGSRHTAVGRDQRSCGMGEGGGGLDRQGQAAGVGVGMAMIVVLAIGVAALPAGDGRPASDSAAGKVPSTRTTTATEPGYTGVVTVGEDGMAAAELALIDPRDPEHSDDDEVVLVSMDGVEQGRGPLNGWHPSHPDQGADVRPMPGGFVLTAAPPLDGPVPGCGAVHGSAGLRVAVCGRGRAPDEIRRIDLYGQERHLIGPVDGAGHWRFAFLSPDGGWVLAQWSGRCESTGAFLIDMSNSERVPVAALETSSLAIGWSTDGRAIVGSIGGRCGPERSERGTYLVEPESLERRRLHELAPVTRLTGDYEWSGNRLERVMSRAWRDRNLEPLGGQPSHGGGDAEAGIVFDGHDVGIWAVPLDELPPDWEAPDELTFTCGSDRYFLADRGPSGSTEEAPAPDWDLLERAARRLVPGLYCTLGAGSDRPGVPMGEKILFAFLRHGSTWAVGTSGTEYRLTHGPGDSGPAAGPDRSTIAFGRLNYEGVYDETVVLDARRGRTQPVGVAGVATFSADGQLAVGEPVDDDLADTEIVVREPGSWRETARIALGPHREVGSVVDLAWDVDDRSLLAAVAHWNVPDRPSGTALWRIDTVGASAHRLAVRDGDGAWIIGNARVGGAFPVIRKTGNQAIWGELRVSSETAGFESWGAIPDGTDGVSLDPSSVAYLSPAGKVQLRRAGPSFTFEPGPEEAFLIGDGRDLFLLSRSGRLTHLLPGVAAASSPPATDS